MRQLTTFDTTLYWTDWDQPDHFTTAIDATTISGTLSAYANRQQARSKLLSYRPDLSDIIVHHVTQPFKPTISIEDGIEHYSGLAKLTEAARIANVNIWSELPATVAACVMDDDSDPIRARYQLRILAIQITYADCLEAFERATTRWFPQTPTQRAINLI